MFLLGWQVSHRAAASRGPVQLQGPSVCLIGGAEIWISDRVFLLACFCRPSLYLMLRNRASKVCWPTWSCPEPIMRQLRSEIIVSSIFGLLLGLYPKEPFWISVSLSLFLSSSLSLSPLLSLVCVVSTTRPLLGSLSLQRLCLFLSSPKLTRPRLIFLYLFLSWATSRRLKYFIGRPSVDSAPPCFWIAHMFRF